MTEPSQPCLPLETILELDPNEYIGIREAVSLWKWIPFLNLDQLGKIEKAVKSIHSLGESSMRGSILSRWDQRVEELLS